MGHQYCPLWIRLLHDFFDVLIYLLLGFFSRRVPWGGVTVAVASWLVFAVKLNDTLLEWHNGLSPIVLYVIRNLFVVIVSRYQVELGSDRSQPFVGFREELVQPLLHLVEESRLNLLLIPLHGYILVFAEYLIIVATTPNLLFNLF